MKNKLIGKHLICLVVSFLFLVLLNSFDFSLKDKTITNIFFILTSVLVFVFSFTLANFLLIEFAIGFYAKVRGIRPDFFEYFHNNFKSGGLNDEYFDKAYSSKQEVLKKILNTKNRNIVFKEFFESTSLIIPFAQFFTGFFVFIFGLILCILASGLPNLAGWKIQTFLHWNPSLYVEGHLNQHAKELYSQGELQLLKTFLQKIESKQALSTELRKTEIQLLIQEKNNEKAILKLNELANDQQINLALWLFDFASPKLILSYIDRRVNELGCDQSLRRNTYECSVLMANRGLAYYFIKDYAKAVSAFKNSVNEKVDRRSQVLLAFNNYLIGEKNLAFTQMREIAQTAQIKESFKNLKSRKRFSTRELNYFNTFLFVRSLFAHAAGKTELANRFNNRIRQACTLGGGSTCRDLQYFYSKIEQWKKNQNFTFAFKGF